MATDASKANESVSACGDGTIHLILQGKGGSWIKTLKEDKNEFFRAAHDASRAADFLLILERDRSIARAGLQVGSELDWRQLGGFPSVALAREATNRGSDRGDLGLGLQSAGTGRRTSDRQTLGRARTTGLGR
jgi:hypothetical protein